MATVPLGRYGEPEEFGRAAAFLLSPASGFTTGVMLAGRRRPVATVSDHGALGPDEARAWRRRPRDLHRGHRHRSRHLRVHRSDWDEFDAAKLPDHRFVAVDGDDVLGWVAVSPTSSRPVYRGVVENALYVTERARGRGVGRALLEELVASTDAADVWTIVAGIFPENTTSLALHESFGFRRLGVRERIGLMSSGPMAGTWRDVVWMERRRPA